MELRADLDRPAAQKLRLAEDHVDLVLLEQEGDAGVETAGNLARARDHFDDVGCGRGARDAEFGAGAGEAEDFRGTQQRLGGNAAPVEADAAEMLALDNRGAQPELSGANRRDIAAGARADDQNVVSLVHSGRPRNRAESKS